MQSGGADLIHGTSLVEKATAIWREALRLLVVAWGSVAAFLGLMISTGVLVDTQGWGEPADIALMVVDFLATFALTMVLLRTGVPGGRRGSRGFWTYFGLSFLSGIAILLGLVLLIIPGLVVWARLAPSAGYALADDMEVSDAMSKSWDATGDHILPIMLAHLPAFAAGIGGGAVFFALFDDAGPQPWSVSLAVNVLTYGSTALGIVLGLAVFTLLARSESSQAGADAFPAQ